MAQVRRVLGFAFGLWALAASVLSGLLIGTLGVLPFVVLPRGRRERYAMHAAQLWASVVVWPVLLTRVRVSGRWALPRGQGAILFCNHRSWLDPVLLMAITRSNGLSKQEIASLPVIGLYGRLAGAIFFDRRKLEERQRARREVVKLARGGHRIQVFPEGTRSLELRRKVYLTTAHDAFAHGLPVVPCAVWGTERTLPREPAAFPLQRVRLDVGSPLWPADHPDAETFARACWDAVARRVEALREEDARWIAGP